MNTFKFVTKNTGIFVWKYKRLKKKETGQQCDTRMDYVHFKINLPEHGSSLQGLVSNQSPVQFAPPLYGFGLVQYLFFTSRPPPQLTLQYPQFDHSVQLPSSGKQMMSYKKNNESQERFYPVIGCFRLLKTEIRREILKNTLPCS